ncbi:MAG: phosphotransferase [Caldilineaceae bacterium]
MNQFLVQQILEQYRLGGASVYPLHSYNNFVYRIESADKQRFSLRICGFPEMKLRSMTDEMLWLDFVAQRNPRLAPRPVANRQGELVTVTPTPEGERLSCLFAWIEGTELRGSATPLEMRKIGQSAAALHNIAREFPFPDATSDFRSGYRYDQTLMLSHHSWIDEHRSAIGTENVGLLERAIDYVVAEMNRIGARRTNYGVIHADLHLGNVLVQDGEVAIMDFEQLGRGHYLYDLTVLWTELLDEPANFAPLWQSFVAGYAEVAELPFSHEEELNPFIVGIQLNALDWIYNATNPAVRIDYGPRLPFYYESIRRRVG